MTEEVIEERETVLARAQAAADEIAALLDAARVEAGKVNRWAQTEHHLQATTLDLKNRIRQAEIDLAVLTEAEPQPLAPQPEPQTVIDHAINGVGDINMTIPQALSWAATELWAQDVITASASAAEELA